MPPIGRRERAVLFFRQFDVVAFCVACLENVQPR
jgi:hypothetical protein